MRAVLGVFYMCFRNLISSNTRWCVGCVWYCVHDEINTEYITLRCRWLGGALSYVATSDRELSSRLHVYTRKVIPAVRRSIANLAPFYVMDSHQAKSYIHQKSSIPKSTGAGNERAARRSWTGSQEHADSKESVHLKLEQRSHGFFQVGGFLFVFLAFPFQLGEQVLQVSWHSFAS